MSEVGELSVRSQVAVIKAAAQARGDYTVDQRAWLANQFLLYLQGYIVLDAAGLSPEGKP